MNTDKVHIDNLRLRCIIGINDWEREKKQDVIINIVMYTDMRKAGASDNIKDAVNYRTIAKNVIDHVEQSSHKLVESLAESIAGICFQIELVHQVEVSIRKPGALRFADAVGVTISRQRAEQEESL